MASPSRSNYRPKEVRRWVEHYEEYNEVKDTKPGYPLHALLCLIDIDLAMSRLSIEEQRVLFLLGRLALPQREVAEILGVSQTTVHRHYLSALETLTTELTEAYE